VGLGVDARHPRPAWRNSGGAGRLRQDLGGASARRGSARELVRASGVIGAGPGSGVGE